MQGLMQNWPLLVPHILDHAARFHGDREMVSRLVEGPIHRTTYAELHSRTRKLANALKRWGVKQGDVIGTLAWNTHRHYEAWYAIMGLGAVCHTLNPRLFTEQLSYIINHAEDKLIFVDSSFIEVLEKLGPELKNVRAIIVMTDRAHMPETDLPNTLCYEELLAAETDDFAWVDVDENAAAGICYTSGTTGNPKGVVYSHRSNVLHALTANLVDSMGSSSRDVIMPVVPLFHANAWSLTFSAPMVGAKLVNPGPNMDGASIYELLDTEKVTFTAAVPTIWLNLLNHLESTGAKLPYLERVAIGGSACPRVMMEKFQNIYDVEVIHAWGMTEMSPLGTIGTLKGRHEDLDDAARIDLKLKQGRPPFTVDMKIVDDDGNELPWDGTIFGHLMVRGPSVVSAYLKGDGGTVIDQDNWFQTGDVATIDADGFMQITDRSKDVIKSGGEWISSIEIENLAVGHPDVAEAAVIGLPHPKWDERPLLIIVPKDGAAPTKDDILSYLSDKIAKWWMPDDVAFVTEIPHTATGKIQKIALREQFENYVFPTAKAAE